MTIRISGGFFGLLTILFVGLKLARIIDWPWVWVLSPLWIPAALGLCGVLLALAIAMIAMIFFRGFFKSFIKKAAITQKPATEKNVTPEKQN